MSLGFVSGPGGDPCWQRVAQICLRVCAKGRITSAVNAGEKMHRQAGVRLHHGWEGATAGARHLFKQLTLNSAFQFDPMSLLSRPDLGSLGHGAQRRGWEERSHAQRQSGIEPDSRVENTRREGASEQHYSAPKPNHAMPTYRKLEQFLDRFATAGIREAAARPLFRAEMSRLAAVGSPMKAHSAAIRLTISSAAKTGSNPRPSQLPAPARYLISSRSIQGSRSAAPLYHHR
jgi:hypothetical protein